MKHRASSQTTPRTVTDELTQHKDLGHSMLAHLVKTNPNVQRSRPQRQRSIDQQMVFDTLLRTPREFFGSRDRNKTAIRTRLGDALEQRLMAFLGDNPAVSWNHFVEYALHRLLEDLGE
ncbi:MAG: hypothetical protein ACYDHD_00225 [Vulcanimicrobiaceae bacterium]